MQIAVNKWPCFLIETPHVCIFLLWAKKTLASWIQHSKSHKISTVAMVIFRVVLVHVSFSIPAFKRMKPTRRTNPTTKHITQFLFRINFQILRSESSSIHLRNFNTKRFGVQIMSAFEEKIYMNHILLSRFIQALFIHVSK